MSTVTRRRLEQDSLFTDTITGLVSGALFIDYVKSFAAGPWLLGVGLALPYFSQPAQYAALALGRRLGRSPKTYALAGQLTSRLALVPMVALPWLATASIRNAVVIVSLLLYSLGDALFAAFWTALVQAEVNEGERDRFFAAKLRLQRVTLLTGTLVGGQLVDQGRRWLPHHDVLLYPSLWLLLLLWSVVGTLRLARTPMRRANQVDPTEVAAGASAWLAPLRDFNYRRLVLYLFGWDFAVYLSTSFFSAYMMTMLHFTVAATSALATLSQLTSVLAFRLVRSWGEGRAHRTLLLASSPVYLACIVAWAFIPAAGPPSLSLALAAVNLMVFGVATAATSLGNSQIAFASAPPAHATTYVTLGSVASSTGAGLGSLVGGFGLQLCDENGLVLRAFRRVRFNTWDSFFFVAAALGVGALAALARVREPAHPRTPSTRPAPAGIHQRYGRDFN